jgi:hypothetical protein
MIIACMQFQKLRYTEVYMDMLGINGCGLQGHLLLTDNCTVWSSLCLTWAFKILSLRTSHLVQISSHNSFSNTSFGSQNIQVCQNQVKSAFKALRTWTSLRSAVHGWVGVAGHHAESLNRICLLRLSLRSSSSLDRDWTCRRYFRIWMYKSNNTT